MWENSLVFRRQGSLPVSLSRGTHAPLKRRHLSATRRGSPDVGCAPLGNHTLKQSLQKRLQARDQQASEALKKRVVSGPGTLVQMSEH